MSDQERISPYNINTLSSRQVVRLNVKYESTNYLGWSNTKFPELRYLNCVVDSKEKFTHKILGV